MTNLTDIVSSSFARVAAIVAAVTATTALVTFSIAYFVFASVSDNQLRQLVNTDAAGLAELFAADGPGGVEQSTDDRLALRPVTGEEPVYVLADENGTVLAGNAANWVDAAPLDASWVRLDLDLGQRTVPVLGRALLMPENVRLFVGRTTVERDAALAQLRRTYGLGFLASLVLGGCGGLIAAWFVRGKVGQFNIALQAVREGALNVRAPGENDRDEFGLLARNVNAALERIERLVIAQREVNDLTAHELKAPLGRIDHLLSRSKDDPALTQAREQISDMTEMIEQLMDISAVTADIGDARNLETVDLGEIVDQLGALFGDVAAEKNIRLTIDTAAPFILPGNRVQLTRMISNLMDNAIKFAPEGGAVSVRTDQGPALIITDNGPGIPEDERERIFSRFARSARAKGVKGHGLGLSFVHAVVRRHGLRIAVDAADPGGEAPGARFTVTAA